MSFTDPRLPGKEYKTERGLKAALRWYEKNSPQNITEPVSEEAPVEQVVAVEEPYTHIRNIHGGPVRLRLTGEKREDSRSIRLQGRGQRGDTVPVTEAERRSADYANNFGLLFEPLTTAEAESIYYNQTTNQQAVHPTVAALRNDNGQPMSAQGVVIQQELSQRSITVATETRKENGKMDIARVAVQRAMPVRAQLPGTEDRPAESYIRDNINEREREILADKVARSKAEGPEAGLAGFSVRTIDPALRTPNVPVTGSLPASAVR